MDWQAIRHFTPEEFDDPAFPGSWRRMNPETIRRLDDLREATGWAIITHNKYGLRGCMCIKASGHSANSYHYATNPHGASAVDFHFETSVHPREQALAVLRAGFKGVGIYQDQGTWNGAPLPIWFHVDMRPYPQVWKREGRKYIYLLQ